MKYMQNHLKRTMKPIKLSVKHIDDTWSIDLTRYVIDYSISNNNNDYRYIFSNVIDNFSKYCLDNSFEK